MESRGDEKIPFLVLTPTVYRSEGKKPGEAERNQSLTRGLSRRSWILVGGIGVWTRELALKDEVHAQGLLDGGGHSPFPCYQESFPKIL